MNTTLKKGAVAVKHHAGRHKGYGHRSLKHKYRRLAAAVAGAFVLAAGGLPGVPPAVAHAMTPTPTPEPSAPVAQLHTSDQAKEMGGEKPANYQKELKMVATAYAPGPHDNAQWGNLTHLGTQVRPGVIAVDPRVIPLGSKVFIQYENGRGEYARAEDTGGAIKGNRIDIAMRTVAEAKKFGMQDVTVFVVNTPKDKGI